MKKRLTFICLFLFAIAAILIISGCENDNGCPTNQPYRCMNLGNNGRDANNKTLCSNLANGCCGRAGYDDSDEPNACVVNEEVRHCYAPGRTCCYDCFEPINNMTCISGTCMNCSSPKTICGKGVDVKKCCGSNQYCYTDTSKAYNDTNKNNCVANCDPPMAKCGKICYDPAGGQSCCPQTLTLYFPIEECCPDPCPAGQVCNRDLKNPAQCVVQNKCGTNICGATETSCCSGGTECYDPKVKCCDQDQPGCRKGECTPVTGGNAYCKQVCTGACSPSDNTVCKGITDPDTCNNAVYDEAFCGTTSSSGHDVSICGQYCKMIGDSTGCNGDSGAGTIEGCKCEWKDEKKCSC